jgi:hypothetical protein
MSKKRSAPSVGICRPTTMRANVDFSRPHSPAIGASRDVVGEVVTDEDDLAILEDDLATLVEPAPLAMADEPLRGQQDAIWRSFFA